MRKDIQRNFENFETKFEKKIFRENIVLFSEILMNGHRGHIFNKKKKLKFCKKILFFQKIFQKKIFYFLKIVKNFF